MNVISAFDLLKLKTEAPKQIVSGILTVGYSILSANPKAGKSWASLGMALAVSSGGKAFDAYPVDQGDVLYCALEDNNYRLQKRMNMLIRGKEAPKNLFFNTDLGKLSAGGMEEINEFLNQMENPKLLIIDTLGRVSDEKKGDLYAEDYMLGAALQGIGFAHNIAVLVVHHANKSPMNKGINKVSGTSGVTAAADTVLVLTRLSEKAPKATLDVISRDNEDKTINLDWYGSKGWIVGGSEPPAWGGN